MEPVIYLDNNATTRPAPEVVEALLPWLREQYGNPSSSHVLGLQAEGALVQARAQVAALLGGQPAEIAFTSGGTEALNHALRGAAEAFPAKRHLVTTAVEHSAVRALAGWLQRQGFEITVLGVDGEGRLDLAELEAALRPDTLMVALMAANNETGVRFPVAEAAVRARRAGALVAVDAVQAVGKVPVDVAAWGADLVAFSGHKFHGPKGVGGLWIRRGVRLRPFLVGGEQERGRRGGTENLPGIVGLGKAAELALAHLPDQERVADLRDRLESLLREALPDLRIHGGGAERLPNTSLLALPDVEGEALQLRLSQRGICVSTGSACTTGRPEPSHVLQAMGVPPDLARGTVRLSLGRETTAGEVEAVAIALPQVVQELRASGSMARRMR
ncbi:MAG TPA: aminotransferase class V-fold PLP-dependent enzyme [Holophaga sp.]|nr:aminotransferase class V-fold PLP-dependent enzyme [Holophaga sp.]